MTQKKHIIGVFGDTTGELTKLLDTLTPQHVKIVPEERIMKSESREIRISVSKKEHTQSTHEKPCSQTEQVPQKENGDTVKRRMT